MSRIRPVVSVSLVFFCLFVMAASQVSGLDQANNSVVSLVSEEYSSVVIGPAVLYQGVTWNLESARLSPRDGNGVRTLIVEMQLDNQKGSSDSLVPRSAISMSDSRGISAELDRFANNSSAEYVLIAVGQRRHVTLAFKLPPGEVKVDSWDMKFQDFSEKESAVLSFAGMLDI